MLINCFSCWNTWLCIHSRMALGSNIGCYWLDWLLYPFRWDSMNNQTNASVLLRCKINLLFVPLPNFMSGKLCNTNCLLASKWSRQDCDLKGRQCDDSYVLCSYADFCSIKAAGNQALNLFKIMNSDLNRLEKWGKWSFMKFNKGKALQSANR